MWECIACNKKHNTCRDHIEHLLSMEKCLLFINQKNKYEKSLNPNILKR